MIPPRIGKVILLIVVLLVTSLFFLFSGTHYISSFLSSDLEKETDSAGAEQSSSRKLEKFHGEVSEGQETEEESAGINEKEEASPANQFQEAQNLFQQGKYPETSDLLKEILETDSDHHDVKNLLGWCHYRMGDFKGAQDVFEELLKDFPDSVDVMSGLAYCQYQNGEYLKSENLFMSILKTFPGHVDALKGLGIVKKTNGDLNGAKELFKRALAVNPDNSDTKILYEQLYFATLGNDRRRKGPLSKEMPLTVRAKAGSDYLSVYTDGEWKDIFIKGVNLGVALPGKFPAEFPMDKNLYLDWLDKIAGMNANTIRVYTLLPPVFYKALKEHNEKEEVNKLWLIQGVWVELPPEHDFYDAHFMEEFEADIERVIDAVHGNIDIALRPGHAYGRYEDDVSEYLLAVILGREWEPFSVIGFNDRYPRIKKYKGDYFCAKNGNPMECWIAEICDFTAQYENDMYREQHPLSFSNWPTLDPLRHPTETSKAEENDIKKKLGMKVAPVLEDVYDDDAVTVDTMRIVPTDKMKAGFFASYHVYPYHPDFLNLDPGYSLEKDSEGLNNYFGYLKDLKKHHQRQPLLVAEFGVPTSRGISHFQPQGMNHGGHTEAEQGEICKRLMKNIIDAKCAGGIVFSWIDEWFKKNWLTVDFENPLERNPLWYNAMDPEQNYGLLAMKPGRGDWNIKIDGKDEDWQGITPIYHDKFIEEEGENLVQKLRRKIYGTIQVERKFRDGFDGARDLKKFFVSSDEGYLYLRLDVLCLDCNEDGKADWDKANYFIGIDTYRRDLGDFRFPSLARLDMPSGMEFMIELKGYDQSKILVDEPYDTFMHTAEGWGPYQSRPNRNGKYGEIKAETNRERYGRDGTIFPSIIYSKSPLKYGSMEKNSKEYHTLCDWYLDADKNFIEIRIPWSLLNVTDPSSGRVLHQERSHLPPLDTVETDGFIFYVVSINPEERYDFIADSFPSLDQISTENLSELDIYLWDSWQNPAYHTYLKDSYYILKDDFLNIRTYIIK